MHSSLPCFFADHHSAVSCLHRVLKAESCQASIKPFGSC